MADITFTGNKKLKSINWEWTGKFPYLYLSFYDAKGKVHGSWTDTHASIRVSKNSKELSTNAGMKVSTFESRYEDAYGCKIEIKYIKGSRTYRTLGEHNDLTLSEMNAWAKDNGGAEIREDKPDWF